MPGSGATDKDQLPPSRTSHDHMLVRTTRLNATTSCLLDTEMTKPLIRWLQVPGAVLVLLTHCLVLSSTWPNFTDKSSTLSKVTLLISGRFEPGSGLFSPCSHSHADLGIQHQWELEMSLQVPGVHSPLGLADPMHSTQAGLAERAEKCILTTRGRL